LAVLKNTVIRAGLETLYFTGAHRMMEPYVGGIGAILTLHHVRPSRPDRFQPNRLLEITPQFLEQIARALRESGLDLISLAEMHRRLTEGDFRRRFVCFTIDDGYRDTFDHAYPILKKHEIPFAIYVATSFADRMGELWWLALEAVVARNVHIDLAVDGRDRRFDCETVDQKRRAFDAIYGWLRYLKSEDELRAVVRELCARYHVDISGFCRELCMSWPELARLVPDPLVTIGAHTVNHVMLAKVPAAAAEAEMDMSRRGIEAALGVPVEHLCYPVGDQTSAGPREFALAAKLGFKTAVTTRPGVLYPEHREHLTALPRISVNGEYQQMRYLRVLMSGAATAVWNGFRRVNAA
jgi:peptidoglycan/xylan/chitin deacetylase (PgdA/CDA1 family)